MQKRPRLLERVELPVILRNTACAGLLPNRADQKKHQQQHSSIPFLERGVLIQLFPPSTNLFLTPTSLDASSRPSQPASSFHAFFTDKKLDSPAITSQIDLSQWPSLCVRRSLAPRSRSPQGRRKERESGAARGAKEADQFHQVLGPPARGHGSVWSCLVSLFPPSIFGLRF